jgi:hypothetical protein
VRSLSPPVVARTDGTASTTALVTPNVQTKIAIFVHEKCQTKDGSRAGVNDVVPK